MSNLKDTMYGHTYHIGKASGYIMGVTQFIKTKGKHASQEDLDRLMRVILNLNEMSLELESILKLENMQRYMEGRS